MGSNKPIFEKLPMFNRAKGQGNRASGVCNGSDISELSFLGKFYDVFEWSLKRYTDLG